MRLKTSAIVIACAVTLTACKPAQDPTKAGPPPAVPVTIVSVESQSVPLVVQLSGRTTPFAIAEIRPQVGGIIQKRSFVEGGLVKAGQPLYQIDPTAYQANLDSAKASLAKAQATLASASLKASRFAELVKIEAVSRQANDEAIAAEQQARADVESAKAALAKATLDLDYTRVLSPISGRIGRSSVTVGALVTANQGTALATVQQLDPIYADVTQASVEMLRLKQAIESGRLSPAKDKTLPVELVLEDGSMYSIKGKLEFSEVTVDQTTGSVTLRAVFPNPKGELLPGMYIRARLTQAIQSDAIVVPQAAVSRDPRGNAFVLIVNADSKAEVRPVTISQAAGNAWIVTDGLQAGEKVIVEGLQKARPGMLVKPEEKKAD